MKFAFIVMSPVYGQNDRAAIHDGSTKVIGVSNIDEACTVAKELYEAGIGCIELCGAFGEEGAKKIIQATQNKIPVGYVIHFPEQDALFEAAFGKTLKD